MSKRGSGNTRDLRCRLTFLMAQLQMETGEFISQDSVAEATGIDNATISRLINFSGDIKRIEINKTATPLCEYFKCDLGDLFTYLNEDDFRVKHNIILMM